MVPVLTRDARRMEQARRCRPDADTGATRARVALVRAVAAGSLDRAVDVAATLELRGYATRRSAPRGRREPLSRHDLAFGAAAAGLVLLFGWALVAGVAGLSPYPRTTMDLGIAELVLAVAIILVALAPFAARRGVERP